MFIFNNNNNNETSGFNCRKMLLIDLNTNEFIYFNNMRLCNYFNCLALRIKILSFKCVFYNTLKMRFIKGILF